VLAEAAAPRAAFERWREEPQPWCPELILLPSGEFTMGAPAGEAGSREDERPQRSVTIGWPFALGRCAVSFAEWEAAIRGGADLPIPSDAGWGRGARPVINVSWVEADAFCAWLNKALGLPAGTFRLPSEAEWEYACRAGTTTAYSTGATISAEQANFDGAERRTGAPRNRTVAVGSLPANGWGLHEMHGNVSEWVADAHGPYPAHPTDAAPLQRGGTPMRGLRGGSWNTPAGFLRSAQRGWELPETRDRELGFRVARSLF